MRGIRLLVGLALCIASATFAAEVAPGYAHYTVTTDYTCQPRSAALTSRPWLRPFARRMTMGSHESCVAAREQLKSFLAGGYACDDTHSYDVVALSAPSPVACSDGHDGR